MYGATQRGVERAASKGVIRFTCVHLVHEAGADHVERGDGARHEEPRAEGRAELRGEALRDQAGLDDGAYITMKGEAVGNKTIGNKTVVAWGGGGQDRNLKKREGRERNRAVHVRAVPLIWS